MRSITEQLQQLSTRPRDTTMILGFCLAWQAFVFVLDWITPLGYSVWMFYVVSIGVAALHSQTWATYAMAVLAIVLTGVGYVVSPPLMDTHVAATNRLMGSAVFVAVAYLGSRVVLAREVARRDHWLKHSESALSTGLVGALSPEEVGQRACAVLRDCLGGVLAAMYRVDGDVLRLCGGHGVDADTGAAVLKRDDGVAAQALRDAVPRVLPVPAGHLPLHSALGRSDVPHVGLIPLRHDGQAVGVIEIGLLAPPREREMFEALARHAGDAVGTALQMALTRRDRERLLEQTQQQAEELQLQQEELRTTNEELHEHGESLRRTQQQLEQQQAALEQANIGLEASNEELAAASRYKSEFLANMSHELRTPLNSALILSQILADNRGGRLAPDEVRYAQTIHEANQDLLVLINDILDLSKIEAGHVDLHREDVDLPELMQRLHAMFAPQARPKGLALEFFTAPDAPRTLHTDGQRLQQVLKNLLANAIKFTARGHVRLHVAREGDDAVRLEVSDTGIGIAPQHHALVFEAFRQADGGTSREYGGTGLGLSITRELVTRMGGHIALHSALGQGSRFTVVLPTVMAAPAPQAAPRAAHGATATAPQQGLGAAAPLARDAGRHVLLVVEDDDTFAFTLCNLVRDSGYDCVVTRRGEEALTLARRLRPAGVLLDLALPDIHGMAVLQRLKADPATAAIPVHVISAFDADGRSLSQGAVGHLVKPATRDDLLRVIARLREHGSATRHRLLLVEDDAALRDTLATLLGANEFDVVGVGSVGEALACMQDATGTQRFDGLITDIALPDGSGIDLLQQLADDAALDMPPAFVYTGRHLSDDEQVRLRRLSRGIIVKGSRSAQRLIGEVSGFLRDMGDTGAGPSAARPVMPAEPAAAVTAPAAPATSVPSPVSASTPPAGSAAQAVAAPAPAPLTTPATPPTPATLADAGLAGRRILLAEDDVRNVFALTAILEPLGAALEIVRNGRDAVARCQRGPAIELVLMDSMMPEMDGLEATRALRATEAGATLPIIALTAKAMPEDRRLCLESGANDYLAKPVDAAQLVSLCRIWLQQR